MSTDTTERRPHFSASQLDLAARCGVAFDFKYNQRLPTRNTLGQFRGKSVHHVAETNFRQKIETHKDLPLDDLKDLAAAKFDDLTNAGDYDLDRDERRKGTVRVLNEAKDAAVNLAGVFGRKIAPKYQPAMVEQPVTISLPGTHDLVGIIDLIDEENWVTDFKTTARKLTPADADHSIQLTVYAAGFYVLTGEPPAGVRLHAMTTWARPTVTRLDSSRSDEDFLVLANRVNALHTVIATSAYMPAPVGAWWCSKKYCPYWSQCPFVNGRRASE